LVGETGEQVGTVRSGERAGCSQSRCRLQGLDQRTCWLCESIAFADAHADLQSAAT